MKNVWIIFYVNGYDCNELYKCFSSEEKAKNHLKNMNSWNGYHLSEDDKRKWFFIEDYTIE